MSSPWDPDVFIAYWTVVKPLKISIRPLTFADEPFLWEMLYEALYVGEGKKKFLVMC